MTVPRVSPVLLGALGLPLALAAQASAPAYRGFAAGAAYRDFAERARALAWRDPMVCNTSRATAQLMECGVLIQDPADSARFYLSAYVLEGKVALVSFGDSGGAPLVDRVRRDLTARFGPGRRTGPGTVEWAYGRRVVRFNWRGSGPVRWVYITLEDRDVMDRISRYVKRP
ncbi:MAG TPA: hypothetical protein VNI61_02220 [Gemmatimonadales bacterium]|nr:hypothetical protein [Gemmatimonadales bacterium]